MRIGLIGLGAMGRNLALGLAERGVEVVAYSYDANEGAALASGSVIVASSLDALVRELPAPRAVFVMVTAGSAVDDVIGDLESRLQRGDTIVDLGNSHYQDTERRQARLQAYGIDMLGVGVSGGAEGARHGASVMVGGDRLVFERLEACFEAMAVQVHGHRCLAHVGPGGAGHFVKMVHNGIEYGAMQVIAEVWQCMEAIGFTRSRESELFGQWQSGPAAGFLTSIVAGIVDFADPLADGYLLDQVSDVAGQKGTGRWTLEVALELGVAVPVIAAALEARLLSGSSGRSSGANRSVSSDMRDWPKLLERAVASGMLAAFAQGFDLLSAASERFGWQLDLPGIARTWQGGCIIRAAMLEDIGLALTAGEPLVRAPGLANFRDPVALREVVAAMTLAGIAPPAMGAVIAWFDGLESARLPTALIQAQRDYFGAHTYERRDRPGKFTTDWRKR